MVTYVPIARKLQVKYDFQLYTYLLVDKHNFYQAGTDYISI